MNITRRQFTTLTVGALVAVTLKPWQIAASLFDSPVVAVIDLPQGTYEAKITRLSVSYGGGFYLVSISHPSEANSHPLLEILDEHSID